MKLLTACGFFCWGVLAACAESPSLAVVSLNPIASDIIQQVGGSDLRLIELMKPGQNPHEYQPSPSELQSTADAGLFVAMGKGLESYLPDLKNALNPDQSVYELGASIPSLVVNAAHTELQCCPGHAHGTSDPHWWHSVPNVKRAARGLARELGIKDPARKEAYILRYRAYSKRLDALDAWIRDEVSRLAPEQRRLITSHAAFNYFCSEYGFVAITVRGLSSEEKVRPAHLVAVADALRATSVNVLFPEVNANHEFLTLMAKETDARIGGTLRSGSPDITDPTYEGMMRSNVCVIVKELQGGE